MNIKFDITKQLYTYNALITNVYDGDTYTADIDLGLSVWRKGVKIRLAYVDTPELRGEERVKGLEVRDHVRAMLLNRDVVIQTMKDKTGKYGRLLADIYLPTSPDYSLSEYLIENEMATWY